MEKTKIASFGEIVWDVFPKEKILGGAPLNCAYYCQTLGANSKIISAIGADEDGNKALELIKKLNLETNCIQVSNEFPTGKVLVKVNETGDANYEILSDCAWDSIELSPETLDFVKDADAIVFGTLSQRSMKSRETLNKIIRACPQKALKVFDVNLRQNFYSKDIIISSLELSNILKLNSEELNILAEILEIKGDSKSQAKYLLERFKLNYLILTKGKFGHSIFAENLEINARAKATKVIDTVGAGDSFTAAFITNILQGKSPNEASEAAANMAAEIVAKRGALSI